MAMDRTEYPAMLASLQPDQAVDVLNGRVDQVGKLNTEIANWLQERRRLEELYSNGLRKLARRRIDAVDLGIFATPWTALTNSAENLAESHSALAGKIEVDVERPLREFAGSNREMQAMSNMQGNLGAIARDVDRAKQKSEKLQAKGDTSKMASATSDLESAQVQWESQAPYVFESLQAIDETRWNHLRDVLTQFQTHEVDQVEKHRVSAEAVLNQLLNVETADEIKMFALSTIENKPPVRRSTQNSSAAAATGGSSSTPTRLGAGPSLTPSISHNDESASMRSASIQEPEKKKGGLSGLKRGLGTVMGRRRESKMPQQLAPMSESPERKPKGSPFNSFSGRLGRSKETTLEPPSDSPQRPRSPLRMGSEILEAPASRSGQTNNAPAPPPSRRPQSGINGVSAAPANASTTSYDAPAVPNIPNGSHQNDLAGLEPPALAPSEPIQQPTLSEPQRDSEGYSVPPTDVDPITQAQQEALDSGENVQPQFNVNIRNAPIQDEQNTDVALANMASKLQMQAPNIGPRRLGTVRGRREARNSFMPPPVEEQQPITSTAPAAQSSAIPPSIDAIQTERAAQAPEAQSTRAIAPVPLEQSAPAGGFLPGALAASTFSPFPSSAEPASPFRPASRTAQLGTDHTGDNQSIRSGRSLTSTGSQGHRHPELHDSGLSSSIIETVSTRFEHGQVLSSSLVGEVALAYNPADFSTPFGTETIRLENFHTLEKVAPNPAFISAVPEKEGQYSLNLASLSKTQVAFKYQFNLDNAGTQSPLLLTPAFKIEPTQASIIVSYSVNPAFALHGRTSLTISNVVIALTLEGAKAVSCQSKPVGTFSREKNLIFWNIGDVNLTAGAGPTKLLARFATESEAKSGSVEARWEISGENALGLGSALNVSVQGQPGGLDVADPFADQEGLTAVWKEVKGVRKLASGSYIAK